MAVDPVSLCGLDIADDEAGMACALELAALAAEQGEVPVGAVIVSEGKIIGVGSNSPITGLDPTAHAEVNAIHTSPCKRLHQIGRVPTGIQFLIP